MFPPISLNLTPAFQTPPKRTCCFRCLLLVKILWLRFFSIINRLCGRKHTLNSTAVQLAPVSSHMLTPTPLRLRQLSITLQKSNPVSVTTGLIPVPLVPAPSNNVVTAKLDHDQATRNAVLSTANQFAAIGTDIGLEELIKPKLAMHLGTIEKTLEMTKQAMVSGFIPYFGKGVAFIKNEIDACRGPIAHANPALDQYIKWLFQGHNEDSLIALVANRIKADSNIGLDPKQNVEALIRQILKCLLNMPQHAEVPKELAAMNATLIEKIETHLFAALIEHKFQTIHDQIIVIIKDEAFLKKMIQANVEASTKIVVDRLMGLIERLDFEKLVHSCVEIVKDHLTALHEAIKKRKKPDDPPSRHQFNVETVKKFAASQAIHPIIKGLLSAHAGDISEATMKQCLREQICPRLALEIVNILFPPVREKMAQERIVREIEGFTAFVNNLPIYKEMPKPLKDLIQQLIEIKQIMLLPSPIRDIFNNWHDVQIHVETVFLEQQKEQMVLQLSKVLEFLLSYLVFPDKMDEFAVDALFPTLNMILLTKIITYHVGKHRAKTVPGKPSYAQLFHQLLLSPNRPQIRQQIHTDVFSRLKFKVSIKPAAETKEISEIIDKIIEKFERSCTTVWMMQQMGLQPQRFVTPIYQHLTSADLEQSGLNLIEQLFRFHQSQTVSYDGVVQAPAEFHASVRPIVKALESHFVDSNTGKIRLNLTQQEIALKLSTFRPRDGQFGFPDVRAVEEYLNETFFKEPVNKYHPTLHQLYGDMVLTLIFGLSEGNYPAIVENAIGLFRKKITTPILFAMEWMLKHNEPTEMLCEIIEKRYANQPFLKKVLVGKMDAESDRKLIAAQLDNSTEETCRYLYDVVDAIPLTPTSVIFGDGASRLIPLMKNAYENAFNNMVGNASVFLRLTELFLASIKRVAQDQAFSDISLQSRRVYTL